MTGINDGWVLANGIRTHYSWAGTSGPAVVLLHGGGPGSSGEVGWRLAIPALADAGFRVFAPDQLSMGQTDAREHAWPVNGHQSLVDHIDAFVQALCLDRVHLAGNSQGAYVGLKFALDHPEKVGSLFLIGSATIAGALGVDWPDRENNPGLLALKHYDYTREGMQRFMESVVNDPGKIPAEVVTARHEMANRPGIAQSREVFDAFQATMRSDARLLKRFSLTDKVRDAGLDVQLLWGRQDRFAPIAMGDRVAELVPEWKYTVIDAGHQCQTDEPELVNQMIAEHFSATKEGTRA
jgi:pimeloyl-ACP methyl ester carboxylesterase